LRPFLILLACILSTGLKAKDAEEVFSVSYTNAIKIDGSIQDWKAIPYLSKKFCLDFKPPYTDIQSIKVAMDKENLYLLFNTKNHFGAIKDKPFFKMVLDLDNNKDTGSDKNLRLNKFVPVPGFERVVTMSINKKAIPYYSIFDVSSNLKKVASYPADSGKTSTKGNYMEISIPFKDLIKDNTTISRIIFSELGTEQDWKSKKAYHVRQLDFSKRNQKNVLSVEEEVQLKQKMNSKFSVGWIVILGFGFWLIWPAVAICKKAGIATSNAYLCIIPILGPFIFAFNLSFGKWKLHQIFYAASGDEDYE